MVTGPGHSSVALAVQQLAREKGRTKIVFDAATTELTGRHCSPSGVHWTCDTHVLARGTGAALMQEGASNRFFLTADHAFGHVLERNTTAVVTGANGTGAGGAPPPLNTTDFSGFLAQAQRPRADVIALANAGTDTINTVKQASEFRLVGCARQLTAPRLMVTDVHAAGLPTAQSLLFTEAF